jgi:hypothetical protein
MTNNNKSFYTILALSVPKFIKNSYSIIASSHYLTSLKISQNKAAHFKTLQFDSSELLNRLEYIYDGDLKLIIISDKYKEVNSSKLGNSISKDFMTYTIPLSLFFNIEYIKITLIENKNIQQCIFIFEGLDYGEIVHNLGLFNILISGGSNTKKHILSPIQLRLARFLIAIYPLSGSSVANSFHSYREHQQSKWDQKNKEAKLEISEYWKEIMEMEKEKELENTPSSNSKTKPSDNTGNRKFHTSSYFKSQRGLRRKIAKSPVNSIETPPVPIKRSNIGAGSSTILSYLDSIKSIINDPENTPEKSQSLIENNWMSILLDEIKNEKILLNKYSNRFFKIILEANITLNILQENNVIKKKFPQIYKELNSIDFIFLTYSYCISYTNRLSYTSIAELVGNNILYQLFKKSEYVTFSEFIIQFKDRIIFYKLGDFFITLLTQFPHDLFERNLSPSSFYSKEVAILNTNSEYLEDIKNNIIVNPNTLPMVCKPNFWSEDSFGGFLDNKNKEVSIITGSHQHKHSIENKAFLFKTINYLNSIKFSINNTLLNYLNYEGKFLLDLIKEDNEIQRAITLKIAQTFSNVPFYLNAHAD